MRYLLINRYQPAPGGPLLGGVVKFLRFYPFETDDGDAIVVNLSGTEANVMVMDDRNFRSYRSGGRRVNFFAGHYKSSPAVIRPPSGYWNVTVDLV